jgi:hypothetical protein
MSEPYTPKGLAAVRFTCASVVFAIAFPLAAASAGAGQSETEPHFVEVEAVETKVIDGFFVGVTELAKTPSGTSGYLTNNTSTGGQLCYVHWTTGQPTWIAIPAEPECAYLVELLDTNGIVVPKTKLGKKVGTKFFDFDAVPRKDVKVRHLHVDKRGEPAAVDYLFYPYHVSDLFQIKNPGRYTLRIWFQMLAFPRTGPNRRDYTNNLIRFPPLDYQLVKAAYASTNAVPGGRKVLTP